MPESTETSAEFPAGAFADFSRRNVPLGRDRGMPKSCLVRGTALSLHAKLIINISQPSFVIAYPALSPPPPPSSAARNREMTSKAPARTDSLLYSHALNKNTDQLDVTIRIPPARKVGYARVSTQEQNLELQVKALRQAGCDQLFTDHGISGSAFSRPGLDAALAQLRPGDSLVVWRLDRLGRSLGKLVDLVTHLGNRKIQFLSLNEAINTNSPSGTLVFHLMAAMAQFERALISERTRAGINAARQRGVTLGRKQALTPDQRQEALSLLDNHPINEVAKRYNVHPRTLQRLRQQHDLR